MMMRCVGFLLKRNRCLLPFLPMAVIWLTRRRPTRSRVCCVGHRPFDQSRMWFRWNQRLMMCWLTIRISELAGRLKRVLLLKPVRRRWSEFLFLCMSCQHFLKHRNACWMTRRLTLKAGWPRALLTSSAVPRAWHLSVATALISQKVS